MPTQIGEITVKGRTFPVYVSEEGEFRVVVQRGEPALTARSMDDLKNALKSAVRREHAKVNIPVVTVINHRVVKGRATGLHATTGNLLMTWEDGHHEQSYGGSMYLDPEKLGPDGVLELMRLHEEMEKREHRIKELNDGARLGNLREVVAEAINREADV